MTSLESYAQQANSVLIANLNYQTPPGASYVTNRQSVYWLTSSAGTFTAQGVRHCKISMTAGEGMYADLHTARLTFRLKNAASENGLADGAALPGGVAGRPKVHRLRPLSGPHVFIKRLTLYAGSQLVEDLYPYNRVHEQMELLTPKDWKVQAGIFDYRSTHGAAPKDPVKASVIVNGDTLTVSLQLCSGLFGCGKYWPLKYAPIHIHLEFEEPAKCLKLGAWEDAVDGAADINETLNGSGAATDVSQVYTEHYEIQDVRMLADVVRLDENLQNEYDKLIMGGGSLTVHTNQYITHSQAITGENPLVSVTRGCTRLKQIFWSFERNIQPVGVTTVNDFYHPRAVMGTAVNAVSDQKNYECWWQIGSKRLPQESLRTTHEFYRSLLLCLGLSYDREEPLDLTMAEYLSNRHMGGINCERVLGVGFTGLNTRNSGDLLTCTLSKLNVPTRYGSVASPNGNVRMLHILLIAEAIIDVRMDGVTVAD